MLPYLILFLLPHGCPGLLLPQRQSLVTTLTIPLPTNLLYNELRHSWVVEQVQAQTGTQHVQLLGTQLTAPDQITAKLRVLSNTVSSNEFFPPCPQINCSTQFIWGLLLGVMLGVAVCSLVYCSPCRETQPYAALNVLEEREVELSEPISPTARSPQPRMETLSGVFQHVARWWQESSGVVVVVLRRSTVLVTLLLIQSVSSFVMQKYSALIQKYVIVSLFITMLIGAGGNAGTQATVRAITGLVAGEFTVKDYGKVLRREMLIGSSCACVVTFIGFFRMWFYASSPHHVQGTQLKQTTPILIVYGISLGLYCIVSVSALVGCTVPFIFKRIGLNPEYAGPTIQVSMDIIGVLITCAMLSLADSFL
eukprot:NODE_2733_length_1107_cov_25.619388_g2608_i0.p1 GENE.NODE_2733_length_1107_cov_25.619388_g2608_i0~~NODE_2733_length_1107_cov_25.619388_g2608_i0.p1  ORF type:complete len:366 (-),score=85.32 NODE_2733_length_1107_cov_25.619388_g2608_i0:8-1105(-)